MYSTLENYLCTSSRPWTMRLLPQTRWRRWPQVPKKKRRRIAVNPCRNAPSSAQRTSCLANCWPFPMRQKVHPLKHRRTSAGHCDPERSTSFSLPRSSSSMLGVDEYCHSRRYSQTSDRLMNFAVNILKTDDKSCTPASCCLSLVIVCHSRPRHFLCYFHPGVCFAQSFENQVLLDFITERL